MKTFLMKLKVTVNPNPFSKELIVFIQGHFTANIVLHLINSKGAVVRTASCTVNKGANEVEIKNPGRLAAGNYSLEIKLLSGDLIETIDLIKS